MIDMMKRPFEKEAFEDYFKKYLYIFFQHLHWSVLIIPLLPWSGQRNLQRDIPPDRDCGEPLRPEHGRGLQGCPEVRGDGGEKTGLQAVHKTRKWNRAEN